MSGVPGATGSGLEAAVEAARAVLGDRARPGMPIGPLTTYRVGGPAAVGVVASDLDELALASRAVKASGLPVLAVGKGSNLLVADHGFPGLAVVLDPDAFSGFEVEGTVVRAGAALSLPVLARRSADAGLTGLEWAVGVPGSVGGGVRMNAGGHGSDISATLVRCRVVPLGASPGPSGRVEVRTPEQLRHTYRSSAIRPEDVVVDAEFQLAPGDPEAGRETIREIVRWRREHQPGGQNAGSVFTNPSASSVARHGDDDQADPGERSSGWLVERTGLKGFRIGTASVSTKHANFIQADPDGSADDVLAVMRAVAQAVEQRWGIRLHTEIRLIGFPQLSSETGGLG